MNLLRRIFRKAAAEERPATPASWQIDRTSRAPLLVFLFAGDITEAPAEAICTSTNPRLSLLEGSGGAVRERGGWGVKRECEAIVEVERQRSGSTLQPGSVHRTSAGQLPYRAVFHCVGSDAAHRSSPRVIADCVRNALAAADRAGIATIAMPLFAAGHAAFPFDLSLQAMAAALRSSDAAVSRVAIVIYQERRIDEARQILDRAFK